MKQPDANIESCQKVIAKIAASTPPLISRDEFSKLSSRNAASVLFELMEEIRAGIRAIENRWLFRIVPKRPKAQTEPRQMQAEPDALFALPPTHLFGRLHEELERMRAEMTACGTVLTIPGMFKLTLCAMAEATGEPMGFAALARLWLMVVPQRDRAVVDRDLREQYAQDQSHPWAALTHHYQRVGSNIRWYAWERLPRTLRIAIAAGLGLAVLSAIPLYGQV